MSACVSLFLLTLLLLLLYQLLLLVFDFPRFVCCYWRPSVFNNPTVMLLLLARDVLGVYRGMLIMTPLHSVQGFPPSLASPLISNPAVAGIPAVFNIYAVVCVSSVPKVAVVEGVFAVGPVIF